VRRRLSGTLANTSAWMLTAVVNVMGENLRD
jgi:hypothetical protein